MLSCKHKLLKFFYIICLLIITVNQTSVAQEKSSFTGGIEAGMCASQMDGDKQAGYNKAGITAGFWVERSFTKTLSGQFEIRFDQKGAAASNDPNSEGGIYKYRLDYIEIPFIIKYKLYKKWHLEGGLIPSYLLSAVLFDAQIRTPETKFPVLDLPTTVGIDYDLGKNLVINVRFSYSIFPLEGSYNNNVPVAGYYNNAFNFVLYYKLK